MQGDTDVSTFKDSKAPAVNLFVYCMSGRIRRRDAERCEKIQQKLPVLSLFPLLYVHLSLVSVQWWGLSLYHTEMY